MQKLPFHELDHFPSSKGCAGIGVCKSCDRHLTEQVGMAIKSGFLPPGVAFELPYHTLFVWDDSTFTTMPKIPERVN